MSHDPYLRYDLMVEQALQQVVRAALQQVAEQGLVGDHHFYIGFDTTAPNVGVADYLKAQYPTEMVIVLEHQYSNLEVYDDYFSVGLSFAGKPELLRIPFAALTAFSDPSVQFQLSFRRDQGAPYSDGNDGEQSVDAAQVPDAAPPEDPVPTDAGNDGASDDKVVTLSAFRKRT